jgi:hypothetical protein
MSETKDDLKKKILSEMTVDYSSNLERNFSLAKQFVRITKDGLVDVTVKDKVTGPEQIQLYLIGKLYAKQAELTTTDEVGNRELMDQLGIPEGSLLPWLKELRDKNKIRQAKRERNVYHSMPVNLIETTMQNIEKKLHKKA